LEDVNKAVDMIGFLLDFYAFIPAIMWLLVTKNSLFADSSALFCLIMAAFVSYIQWIQVYFSVLWTREMRL